LKPFDHVIDIDVEAARFLAKIALAVVLNEMLLVAFFVRFFSLSVRLLIWKSPALDHCSFVACSLPLKVPGSRAMLLGSETREVTGSCCGRPNRAISCVISSVIFETQENLNGVADGFLSGTGQLFFCFFP